MTESALEAVFRRLITTAGGRTYKLAPIAAGMPDRMVLMPGGRIYLVELKTATGRLRPAQILWHKRAEKLGTHVITLAGREEIESWILGISKHH